MIAPDHPEVTPPQKDYHDPRDMEGELISSNHNVRNPLIPLIKWIVTRR